MRIEDLREYILEIDENYYKVWVKGKKVQAHMHPVTRHEIEKGLDIPGIACWFRLSRIVMPKEGDVRGIMLSYYDMERKRRTVTVPIDKEKKLRVISSDPGVSDFTFRIVRKDQEL